MLNIYIGWDSREAKAWHVLTHSIIQRASCPVRVTPLKQDQLRSIGLYGRPHDALASTEFSLTRFLVPYLSRYTGYSVFLDCDILCQTDLADLVDLARRDPSKAVWVVQHNYTPKTSVKMDGCPQTVYPRKNWSSVMVFNNVLCQSLTPSYVNTALPSALHQLQWADEATIGALPLEWNWLCGEYTENPSAHLLHYTLGGPWFPQYEKTKETDRWVTEWHSIS